VLGDALLAPLSTRALLERTTATVTHSPLVELLTSRETEVLALLARGLSNAEIAQQLFVEQSTVKSHVASLLAKIGVRDRVQAVVFAYEHGIAP
jgi:DNA-binding NarL/FixJ family response regulator